MSSGCKIQSSFLHPPPFRCLTLALLAVQMFDIVQDAVLRRLQDDDLAVIQAALNVQSLDHMISPSILLGTIQSVLSRCIKILLMGECALL